MTLQQLRYVTTVAETGTISGAAKALFISQPSLTAAIQELEKEMGITIFLRTNRGVVLSREGDEFLGYARQVLMQAELLEDRYGAQSSHRQQFAVSAQHYNFAARVFARVVRDMGGERYSMTFRETTTYEVIEDVGRMRSEVGVLVMTEQNGEVLRRLFREYELTYTELVQKDATVYVDKNHPLAGRGEVTEEELEPYPCVTFEQGTHNAVFYSEDISMTAVTPRPDPRDQRLSAGYWAGRRGIPHHLCLGHAAAEAPETGEPGVYRAQPHAAQSHGAGVHSGHGGVCGEVQAVAFGIGLDYSELSFRVFYKWQKL